MEGTATNEPHSPETHQSRSPPPPVKLELAVGVAAEIELRTCPVCRRVFDSMKGMWGHSWVHRERKDQIHTMDPPAGEEAPAEGAWHPWKIDSKAVKDRTCNRCGKVFNSPKAMFGHLHVHYNHSPARKAKEEPSPSKAGPDEAEKQLIAFLPEGPDLNKPVCKEEGLSSSSSSSSSSIDLNKLPSF